MLEILMSIGTPLISWLYYRYILKNKYKTLQLNNIKTEILQSVLITIPFVSIITFYLQGFILLSYKYIYSLEKLIDNKVMFLSQFLFLVPFFYLMIKVIKNYTRESKKIDHLENRTWGSFFLHTKIFLLGTISLIFYVYSLVVSYGIIIRLLSSKDWVSYVAPYISIIVVWITLIWLVSSNIKEKLIVNIKSLNIYYEIGEEIQVIDKVNYENFFINRNMISIYQNEDKKIILIPSEKLIKIEYIYEKNSEK